VEGDIAVLPSPICKDINYLNIFYKNRPSVDNFAHDLKRFMIAFLNQISSNVLQNTLSISKQNQTILECLWCDEFYKISYSLLDVNTYVHGEVDKINANTIQGKVDFVIKNGRTWVIEFLVNGREIHSRGVSEADEHVNRFSGKYKDFNQYEYLVVDFRVGKPAKNDYSTSPNHWIVYYEKSITQGLFELNIVHSQGAHTHIELVK